MGYDNQTELSKWSALFAGRSWDPAAADAAIAGFSRSAGANEMFELFSKFGARDFRHIGHKAIYVANSWRALNTIGWQHVTFSW